MNIHEELRKLKTITPSASYTERSRMAIVGLPAETPRRFTLWRFVLQNIQMGSAIALTALLLMVGFGAVSAWKFFSPFGLNSLDPANLQAEAEAIKDIRVALDSVQYVAPSSAESAPKESVNVSRKGTATEPSALSLRSAPAPDENGLRTEQTESTSSTSPEEATTTVDYALDLLLE